MIISSVAKHTDSKERFKKRIKLRVIYGCLLIIPGIILAILGMTHGVTPKHDTSFINGYVCGIGFGLVGAGIATAIKTFLISRNPDKLKELYIKETDERSIQIKNKALSATLFTLVALLFIASIIIGCINLSSIVFVTLFTVMVVIVIIGLIYYAIFSKLM